MSCFVVSNECISRIALFVANLPTDNQPRTVLLRSLSITAKDNVAEHLGKALHTLNAKAFTGRYEGRDSEDIGTFTYTVPADEFDVPPASILKSLHCFSYQCAERPVDGSPEYNALIGLEEWLQGEVATAHKLKKVMQYGSLSYNWDQIPAYASTSWGD